jgi:hypothetical protein
MRKMLVVITVFWCVSAFAVAIGTLTPAPTDPTNAYWQIVDDGGDNVLACVMEGETIYGLGDDCRIYNTQTLDFTGVTGDEFNLEFDVSLVNDSANDHCLLQMRDSDDSSWTTFEDFTADTAGYEHRTYDLIGGPWGDWTAYDSVYMRFLWVSDDSGTADGVRINDLSIYEMGNAGINEDFEDYSIGDDVDDIGWWEEFYGGEGHWYVDDYIAYGYTPPGSGQFFSCDDDEFNVNYDVAAMTPEILDIEDNDLNVEFDYVARGYSYDAEVWTWVNGAWGDQLGDYSTMDVPDHANYDLSPYLSVGDDFAIGFYYYSYYYWDYWFCIDNVLIDIPISDELFADDFESGLGQWTVNDQAGNLNIKCSSLGKIKGMYR